MTKIFRTMVAAAALIFFALAMPAKASAERWDHDGWRHHEWHNDHDRDDGWGGWYRHRHEPDADDFAGYRYRQYYNPGYYNYRYNQYQYSSPYIYPFGR